MDNNYIKAESIINNASYELKKIFEKADYKGTENREAYNTLEQLIERLEDAEKYIRYLATPTQEGVLKEHTGVGKFYIVYDNGEESHLLSCGNTLEIYIEDEWHIGRVEATDGKYYFYGEGRPFLYTGMRARKRITE